MTTIKITVNSSKNFTLSGIFLILLNPKTTKGVNTNNMKWYSISPKNKINKKRTKRDEIIIKNCNFVSRVFVIYRNPPNTGIIPNIGKIGIIERVSNVSAVNLKRWSGLWKNKL